MQWFAEGLSGSEAVKSRGLAGGPWNALRGTVSGRPARALQPQWQGLGTAENHGPLPDGRLGRSVEVRRPTQKCGKGDLGLEPCQRRAEGAARAQKIVRSTLSDSYLEYLWIKTLNENPNVIYVASEANMPIFKSVGGK